jgi:predicted transcriptional regulator
MARVAVMALKTVFANAVYARTKAYEYRRTSTTFAPGDQVLVYETSPRGLVTGHFLVGRILLLDAPFEVRALERVSEIAEAVTSYLSGAIRATALEIVNPTRLAVPRKLVDVSTTLRAPQSYVFLKDSHGLFRGDR